MVVKELTFERTKAVSSQSANQIVRTAAQFQSGILINCGSKTVNAKSLMGILSLGAGVRGKVRLTIDGKDEVPAAAAMEKALTEALNP